MISTSWVASCFRMANISSCLRMVLAFSTWCSSAKATSSGGVLDFKSWSFISRIGGRFPWDGDRRECQKSAATRVPGSYRERSQVWGDEELGKVPGTRCCDRPEHWEPERDCIRLRSVGIQQHIASFVSAQGEGCGRWWLGASRWNASESAAFIHLTIRMN